MLAKATKNLSQTKKAIHSREKRASDKEQKRHDVFVRDYVATKYETIYAEANAAYEELKSIYPTKIDLTKTYRYLKWKKESGQTSNSEPFPAGVENRSVEASDSVPIETRSPQVPDSESIRAEIETRSAEASIEMQSTDPSDPGQLSNEIEIENLEGTSIEKMDRVVNNIIRDLRQDDEIMRYLNEIEQDQLQEEPFW